MQVTTADNYDEMSKQAAQRIAQLIRSNNAEGKQTVLGLATGNTPIGMYKELVRMYKEEELSFANVVTFNLDEYWPLNPNHPESYHRFMHEHLFNHVDIKKDNIHIPDGTVPKEQLETYCQSYEQAIIDAGGIDLQVLGVGRDGHLGFNERKKSKTEEAVDRAFKKVPFSLDSRTRLVDLSDTTVTDNEPPSKQAITMGLGTIMDAKELMFLANGEKKADIVKEIVDGYNPDIPATLVNYHENSHVYLDKDAAKKLKEQGVDASDIQDTPMTRVSTDEHASYVRMEQRLEELLDEQSASKSTMTR